MQGVVKKWGSSAAIRIPAAVLRAAQLHLDQPIDVRAEGGTIVIEPLRPMRYDILALVAGITDENRHDLIDPVKPAGRETWLSVHRVDRSAGFQPAKGRARMSAPRAIIPHRRWYDADGETR